jgi:hypothetical protein
MEKTNPKSASNISISLLLVSGIWNSHSSLYNFPTFLSLRKLSITEQSADLSENSRSLTKLSISQQSVGLWQHVDLSENYRSTGKWRSLRKLPIAQKSGQRSENSRSLGKSGEVSEKVTLCQKKPRSLRKSVHRSEKCRSLTKVSISQKSRDLSQKCRSLRKLSIDEKVGSAQKTRDLSEKVGGIRKSHDLPEKASISQKKRRSLGKVSFLFIFQNPLCRFRPTFL